MSLSRFPLPSIHRVLEAESPETLPRRPSVITFIEQDEPDMLPVTTSTFPVATIGYIPSTSHLMKTIDLRAAEPIAKDGEEQFSFIVHFPDEDEAGVHANADPRTKKKRPSTSRGLHRLGSSNASDSAKLDISLSFVNTLRKVLPVKMAEALLRKMNWH